MVLLGKQLGSIKRPGSSLYLLSAFSRDIALNVGGAFGILILRTCFNPHLEDQFPSRMYVRLEPILDLLRMFCISLVTHPKDVR